MLEQDKRPGFEELTNSLADIAVESWRFGKMFDRILAKLDVGEQGRYRSQFRWFQKKLNLSLKDAGLWIADLEGHDFDPGMAATPLNIAEFGTDDTLVVEQMLEPTIMGPEGVVRIGTVTLKKVEP